MTDARPGPDALLQLGFAFWGSKALLSAVELGLFTALAAQPRTAEDITGLLGLQRRGTVDWLDALVSLGVLDRSDGAYANAPAADEFLDRDKPSYIGGLLEMANARLYPFWGSLTEALRTGKPQNEARQGGDFFAALYEDPDRLQQFMRAMTAISKPAALALADQFPWDSYTTVVDIGTAEGCMPVELAKRHLHLRGGGFDLPPVNPIFDKYVAAAGLADRLRFYPGDFFTDPLPHADVMIMGHILHDWGLYEKLLLLRKAHEALPDGGALIVYESVIDDDRRANTFGLLMSLNMLIETQEGFDYTGADCQQWMTEAGFSRTYVEPLTGPDSMVVAIK
jgi:O-methyltransferase domain/Dimerisation domain